MQQWQHLFRLSQAGAAVRGGTGQEPRPDWIVRITVSGSVTVPARTGRQTGGRAEEGMPVKEPTWLAGAAVRDSEQATVAPHRIRMISFTGRVLTGALLSTLFCLIPLSSVTAAEGDRSFERSGIHFPGGFDPNTVGDLRGRASGLHRPASGSGPLKIDLETQWERYIVIVCPPWYWDELKAKFLVGEELRVIGSKSLGKDSNLYIIAQEIHFIGQGRSIMLRDKAGTPLWNGHHGKTGSQQGYGGRGRWQR